MYRAGHVRIYQFLEDSWVQMGKDIDGENESDLFGYSVSIDSDGSHVAIGAPDNDGNGNNAGHARIYEYSNGTWAQVGSDIDGEAAGDEFGYRVAIDSDGSHIAIGAPENDGNPRACCHRCPQEKSIFPPIFCFMDASRR